MMRRVLKTTLIAFVIYPNLAAAQGTRLWLQSTYDDFEKGSPSAVAISSRGYLEAAPPLDRIALTPSTYLWSVDSDRQGNAYVGAGSPATVLRITPAGVVTTLFSTKDLSVQSVRVGADGSVYAATLPSGKVYRIKPGQSNLDAGSAETVFDPAVDPAALSGASADRKDARKDAGNDAQDTPRYIWDMAFDAAGRLYIATGGPAAVYRVDLAAGGKPEIFFRSDEEHIRCILFEPDGDLLAGSDGGGLVYRIGKDGKGMVIYNAPKREITALAEAADGRIYVSSVGEKAKSTLPPLPVQGNVMATATITILTPGSVQASSTNSLIPEGSEIDEINAQGAPRKLWASRDDVVYALRVTPQGLLAASGNRGKIYRIQEDGSYLDLDRVASGQATGFAQAPDGLYVASSNPGRLYRLGSQPSAHASYLSDVFDAGYFSQWGRTEVNADEGGAAGPYKLFVRTGNVENPERNWSDWREVPAEGAPAGLVSARFVQWKVMLEPGGRVGSIGVNYLPVNVAPVVDEVVAQPGARAIPPTPQQPQQITVNLPSAQNGMTYVQDSASSPLQANKDKSAVTARWAAHDDNGDDLVFSVYYRGDGEKNWSLLKSGISDRFYVFDSEQLPDGGYRIKVVASDAPSHPPGQALTGANESPRFVIDTTPPAIAPIRARIQGGSVHAAFDALDSASPITHAEYSLDAGSWQYLEPVGKISDSLTEHYDFTVPLPAPAKEDSTPRGIVADPAEHLLTVRVFDRYDNVGVAKAVIH